MHKDLWLTDLMKCEVYHLGINDISGFQRSDIPVGNVFVDAKIKVNDIESVIHLLDQGFHLIDTNIQLTRPSQKYIGSVENCRFATPEDEEYVKQIAASSFTNSRFHLDPQIKDGIANLIKAEWAGNYFKGQRGDWMIVAEQNKEIVGFLQLFGKIPDTILIDLVAVKKDRQGQGWGAKMIFYAIQNCINDSVTTVVGTQISNTASLSFYSKMGFKISSAQYVFHLHQKIVL
jgi:ribosomal protein S18 acetylase RimI-like enzyme